MLRIIMAGLAALALAFAAPPALAQRALEYDTATGYDHPHTHLKLPGTLLGIPMTRMNDLSSYQLDVAAGYEDHARGEVISVFIYRLVSGALPVWFDRAVWAIENRADVYGEPVRLPRAAPFTPPGQRSASAMAATWKVTRPPYRSTGLALIQMDGWLVKIRYSSQQKSVTELAAKVREIAGALGWPPAIAAAPAAYEVRPCKTELELSGEAQLVGGDSMAIGAALIGDPAMEQAGLRPPPPKIWCRDATRLSTGGVYRGDEESDGYLIALSDAGRGIRVERMPFGPNGSPDPRWSVRVIDMGNTLFYPEHDRLLPPEQAIQVLRTMRPAATATTFGKERRIEVTVPGK